MRVCSKRSSFSQSVGMRDYIIYIILMQLGLNEADTLKSISILIYSHLTQSIYAQSELYDAVLIKEIKLNKGVLKLVNEMLIAK